jgi:hypothetical protein
MISLQVPGISSGTMLFNFSSPQRPGGYSHIVLNLEAFEGLGMWLHPCLCQLGLVRRELLGPHLFGERSRANEATSIDCIVSHLLGGGDVLTLVPYCHACHWLKVQCSYIAIPVQSSSSASSTMTLRGGTASSSSGSIPRVPLEDAPPRACPLR